MSLYKGGQEITGVYKGSQEISKIYKGSTLVWEKPTSEWNYEGVMTVGYYDQTPELEVFGYAFDGFGAVFPELLPEYITNAKNIYYEINYIENIYIFGFVVTDSNDLSKLTQDPVILSINGTQYILNYNEDYFGTHSIIYETAHNPFPAVGETCDIKLRYTLAEPVIDWTYEGVMTVGYVEQGGVGNFLTGYQSSDNSQSFMGSLSPEFTINGAANYSLLYESNDYGGGLIFVIEDYNLDFSFIADDDVLLSINNVIYTLIRDGGGSHFITLESNPFPPVGETCDIKLKYTLVEPPVFDEVTIGTQTWMAVNLDIDDGGGGIYAYNDDENNVATYGRLYTWDAAVRVAATQTGWHLPSDAEWATLTDYLGGVSVAGGKLKEVGTTHWLSPNTGATNESGFTARAAGYRSSGGAYSNLKYDARWWTSTEWNFAGYHMFRRIVYTEEQLRVQPEQDNRYFSVRLIKDTP